MISFVLMPSLFARTNAIGLADHELGIEPGKSVTVEWEVYPVPNGDYWSFVNAVRRNWGCNFTIPANVFVDWSSEAKSDSYYSQYIRSRGLKMVSASDAMFDDGKPAMGTAIPLAKQFCDRTSTWMRHVHSVAPDVKALFYINCSLCTEPDAVKKYADSRMLDARQQLTMVAGGGSGGIVSAPLFISTTRTHTAKR